MFADVSDDLNVRARLPLELFLDQQQLRRDQIEDPLRRELNFFKKRCLSGSCGHIVSATHLLARYPDRSGFRTLVRSVIRKLHVYPKVFCFQRRNYFLKRIAIATRYAHRVALNRGLHFHF